MEGGQGGKRAQSFACVRVAVSVKVKEITLDVGTGQEIAGRDGIALENCISRVILFNISMVLGLNFSLGLRFIISSCLLLSCFVQLTLKYPCFPL